MIRADLTHATAARRGRTARVLIALGLGLSLTLLLLGVWAWRFAFADLPDIPDKAALWSFNRPPGITFLDRSGATIAQRGPRHGQTLSLSEMPTYLPRAFLAAEDRRFYSHQGVDLIGLARAAKADLGAHRVVQGGSTITQQLVKNLFLSPDQTLRRKAQEAALAWQIERRISKTEVLELYLNRIYFGEGAYGVEAASQVYFGKSAHALTLPEAALLAALPKAPTKLDPDNDLDAALARSRRVLANMRAEGWITPAQYAAAIRITPDIASPKPGEGDYGYILDLAQTQARSLAAGRAPDLIVTLTVDPVLQAEATRDVREGAAGDAGLGVTQAALVALAPDGAVRALVGGIDYRRSPFDRATQARRQPGSSFKAFVYAAALEAGLTPQTVRADAPVRFGGYAPQNAGGGYSGPVMLRDAFARSINTVAVRVAHEVGTARVAELARRFGLGEIPGRPDLSIALGSYEVTPLDLTAAYQVFQSGGKRVDPFLISQITNAHGDMLYQHGVVDAPQVYDPVRAGEMVRMMQGVVQHGTGRRADFGRPAAGKTGTSQSYRDAWFVGFTPDWVAGVWVGDDRNKPMRHVAGGDLPAAIWRRFMIAAHAGVPSRDFALPPEPEPLPAEASDATAGTSAALQGQASGADAAPADATPDPEPPPARRGGGEPAPFDDNAPPAGAPDGATPADAPPAPPSRAQFYDGLARDLGRSSEGDPR